MWSPPGETFPGHQETSARIIRVLKRMKPKERSMQASRIRPARWSAVSSAAPLLICRLNAPSKGSPSPAQYPPRSQRQMCSGRDRGLALAGARHLHLRLDQLGEELARV